MERRNYNLEIFLVLLHLTGPFADFGIIISSIYIFYLIGFKATIDVFQLFLLLLPNIALRSQDVFFSSSFGQYGEIGWFQIFIPTLKNATIIGPIAVSTKFFSALAIPVRIFLNYKKVENKSLINIWLIAFLLSIIGLYLAVTQGINSTGGITVGLRITLAIGALLIPLSILPGEFQIQLFKIIKISLILFFLGLLNEHWMFVTISFPAIIISSNLNARWKIFSLFCVLIFLLVGSTFTIKLIALISTFLVLFFKFSRTFRTIISIKLVTLFIFLLPLIGVFIIVNSGLSFNSMGNDINTRFLYKLYEDRGGIWMYTLDLIRNSDFFIVPAARDIAVKDYGVLGEYSWGAGAHNIFLEITRQLGLLSAILLFFIIGCQFYRAIYEYRENGFLRNVIFSFFSVFLVYGFTGNSLVYDGVGFLFWLILGQIVYTRKYLKNENIAFIQRI